MNRARFEELLDDWARGLLDEEDTREFESYLALRPAWRDEAEDHRELLRAIREAPRPQAPVGLLAGALAKARSQAEAPPLAAEVVEVAELPPPPARRWLPLPRRWGLGLAAAAILLAAAIGTLGVDPLLRRETSRDESLPTASLPVEAPKLSERFQPAPSPDAAEPQARAMTTNESMGRFAAAQAPAEEPTEVMDRFGGFAADGKTDLPIAAYGALVDSAVPTDAGTDNLWMGSGLGGEGVVIRDHDGAAGKTTVTWSINAGEDKDGDSGDSYATFGAAPEVTIAHSPVQSGPSFETRGRGTGVDDRAVPEIRRDSRYPSPPRFERPAPAVKEEEKAEEIAAAPAPSSPSEAKPAPTPMPKPAFRGTPAVPPLPAPEAMLADAVEGQSEMLKEELARKPLVLASAPGPGERFASKGTSDALMGPSLELLQESLAMGEVARAAGAVWDEDRRNVRILRGRPVGPEIPTPEAGYLLAQALATGGGPIVGPAEPDSMILEFPDRDAAEAFWVRLRIVPMEVASAASAPPPDQPAREREKGPASGAAGYSLGVRPPAPQGGLGAVMNGLAGGAAPQRQSVQRGEGAPAAGRPLREAGSSQFFFESQQAAPRFVDFDIDSYERSEERDARTGRVFITLRRRAGP